MFFPDSNLRILLCVQPTDMRKSFDGLIALVKNHMGEDPLGGCLFAFVNRKRTYMKVLWFERGGFCIWSKRLEQGRFSKISESGVSRALNVVDFKLLLEGLDRRDYCSRKRYKRVA